MSRLRIDRAPEASARTLKIAGSVDAFLEVAEALDRAARSNEAVRFEVSGDTGIVDLTVEPGANPIRIRREETSLRIIGGLDLLYLRAWFIALADRPGRTMGVAPYPGHSYLAGSAIPLELLAERAPTADVSTSAP